MTPVPRIFKGDKWTRIYGSPIPIGAPVMVHRFYPRRRALVHFPPIMDGQLYVTMLWCLRKPDP